MTIAVETGDITRRPVDGLITGSTPEIADMARAARVFQAEARTVTSLDFVIYGDPVTSQALQQELRKIPEPPGHS